MDILYKDILDKVDILWGEGRVEKMVEWSRKGRTYGSKWYDCNAIHC